MQREIDGLKLKRKSTSRPRSRRRFRRCATRSSTSASRKRASARKILLHRPPPSTRDRPRKPRGAGAERSERSRIHAPEDDGMDNVGSPGDRGAANDISSHLASAHDCRRLPHPAIRPKFSPAPVRRPTARSRTGRRAPQYPPAPPSPLHDAAASSSSVSRACLLATKSTLTSGARRSSTPAAAPSCPGSSTRTRTSSSPAIGAASCAGGSTGASYEEIAGEGGGILSTVLRHAQRQRGGARRRYARRLAEMLRCGTTTGEAKSGYGLTTESELKMLRVIRALGEDAADRALADVHGRTRGAGRVPGRAGSAYVDLIVRT